MHTIHFIFCFFIIVNNNFAQSKKEFSKISFTKEISFISIDSSYGSKSTIIEYPKFLVVVELPFIDAGGGKSTDLVQDISKAERFIEYLKIEYNKKPVKYVLSSHWHLHSLSGISPFFKEGSQLIAAKSNWDYSVKNGLFGNENIQEIEKKVVKITKDTTLLKSTSNPIDIVFLDETYTHKPTKDYLFFYLPKQKILHASCMCAMNEVDFQKRPSFIYSDRITDIDKAIKVRNLQVDKIIKLTAEFDEEKKVYKIPVFENDYFTEFKKRGKSIETVLVEYKKYELSFLKLNKGTLIQKLITEKVSPVVINNLVYDFIKQKEFEKAVEWGQILNTYNPGDSNYIDSLGEAYYNLGDLVIAKHYSELLSKLNKEFPNQIKSWEENKSNSQ